MFLLFFRIPFISVKTGTQLYMAGSAGFWYPLVKHKTRKSCPVGNKYLRTHGFKNHFQSGNVILVNIWLSFTKKRAKLCTCLTTGGTRF